LLLVLSLRRHIPIFNILFNCRLFYPKTDSQSALLPPSYFKAKSNARGKYNNTCPTCGQPKPTLRPPSYFQSKSATSAANGGLLPPSYFYKKSKRAVSLKQDIKVHSNLESPAELADPLCQPHFAVADLRDRLNYMIFQGKP